jgi:hypothetical protein
MAEFKQFFDRLEEIVQEDHLGKTSQATTEEVEKINKWLEENDYPVKQVIPLVDYVKEYASKKIFRTKVPWGVLECIDWWSILGNMENVQFLYFKDGEIVEGLEDIDNHYSEYWTYFGRRYFVYVKY